MSFPLSLIGPGLAGTSVDLCRFEKRNEVFQEVCSARFLLFMLASPCHRLHCPTIAHFIYPLAHASSLKQIHQVSQCFSTLGEDPVYRILTHVEQVATRILQDAERGILLTTSISLVYLLLYPIPGRSQVFSYCPELQTWYETPVCITPARLKG